MNIIRKQNYKLTFERAVDLLEDPDRVSTFYTEFSKIQKTRLNSSSNEIEKLIACTINLQECSELKLYLDSSILELEIYRELNKTKFSSEKLSELKEKINTDEKKHSFTKTHIEKILKSTRDSIDDLMLYDFDETFNSKMYLLPRFFNEVIETAERMNGYRGDSIFTGIFGEERYEQQFQKTPPRPAKILPDSKIRSIDCTNAAYHDLDSAYRDSDLAYLEFIHTKRCKPNYCRISSIIHFPKRTSLVYPENISIRIVYSPNKSNYKKFNSSVKNCLMRDFPEFFEKLSCSNLSKYELIDSFKKSNVVKTAKQEDIYNHQFKSSNKDSAFESAQITQLSPERFPIAFFYDDLISLTVNFNLDRLSREIRKPSLFNSTHGERLYGKIPVKLPKP